MSKALHERALLVRLAISQWYNRKTEKELANEVAVAHGATNSEDSYTKVLLPRRSLAPVTSAIAAIRAFHYMHTLPWTSEAIRILPSAGYFDYMAGMKERKDAFELAVKDFAKGYEAAKEAARLNKNTLFRESDYPPVSDIESAFAVQVSCMPVPSHGDFRVALDAGTIRDLEEKAASEATAALLASAEDLRDRFVDALVPYYMVLGDPEKQFHASTIQKAYIIADMIPVLNLAGDEALNLAASRVTKELSHLEADVLRDDPFKRSQAATTARKILDELTAAQKSKADG